MVVLMVLLVLVGLFYVYEYFACYVIGFVALVTTVFLGCLLICLDDMGGLLRIYGLCCVTLCWGFASRYVMVWIL